MTQDYFKRTAIISIALLTLIFVVTTYELNAAEQTGADDPAPIGVETFKARRLALMDSLGEGTAILFSQGEDFETGYRADGDFWYLTGIDEPGAFLMLAPGEIYREILFLPPSDPESERWTGWSPALTDSLKRAWMVDDIRRTTGKDWWIMEAMKHTPVLHLISRPVGPDDPLPPDLELYEKITARIPGVSIRNSQTALESMRMVKSPDEIAAIEKAIAITYDGLTELLAAMHPGTTEYQLEAVLETSFKRNGAQYMAFPAIIAAGGNSHFLHYQKRHDTLKTGQLLLMDVGAKWDRYSADITRTVPIDSRFTPEQAEVYNLVLKAQEKAIAAVKPGVTSYEVHEAAKQVFREAGYVDDYWHWTGHHLGLDTHDPSDDSRPLEPGMVITVEPGIYLPDRGFGVRIEDDVLVTEGGRRVLSAAIPKTLEEVETWVREAKK
jgi:Xaa-Pro aminopeptidase